MFGKLPPTFNFPWVIATALCFWFLFIHAPMTISSDKFFKPRLLWVHLFCVYTIYLVCVQTVFNPFTLNGAARPFHIWAGRIGLILGVVGFYTGLILTWFLMDPRKDLGFSVGITYGGIAQMQAQYMGYHAIKRYQQVKAKIEAEEYQNQQELLTLEDEQDEHLRTHITSMINLFVLACGIPGLVRLVGINPVYLLPSIIGLYCVSYFMSQPIKKRMRAKRASQRGSLTVRSENTELNSNTKALSHYQTVQQVFFGDFVDGNFV